VDATVRIESIDTGNEKRDDHLRSPDFFDAPNHPEMRFTSTEITNVNGNTFQMKGDLTIRGTTKPVVFETELIGTAVDNEGRQRAGFTAATTINRKDFGLTWNRVTEAGGLVVGEDVDITLDIQTIRGDA
jgi:polyisoprenoid-binding protein YceI